MLEYPNLFPIVLQSPRLALTFCSLFKSFYLMKRSARAMDSTPIPMGKTFDMAIKWEHEAPVPHNPGYDTPPHSATFTSNSWGSPPAESWDETIADYMTIPASPTRVCKMPSSPLSVPMGNRHASLRMLDASISPAYLAVSSGEGDFNYMAQHSINSYNQWLTPLSSPCSHAEEHAQSYVDVKPNLVDSEWCTVRSMSTSGQSSTTLSLDDALFLQHSSSPCSTGFETTWNFTTHSSSFNTNGCQFPVDQSSFNTSVGLPEVPVIPSHVNPTIPLFNNLEPLSTSVSSLTVADPEPHNDLHSFSEASSSPSTADRKLRPQARRNRVLRKGQRTRTTSSQTSVTRRNAVVIKDGAYIMPGSRGTGSHVTLEPLGEGRYFNPSYPGLIYKCSVPNCTAAFKRREHLTRHELKHSGKCRYACPLLERTKAGEIIPCHKRTSRHDNLMDHMSKHCRSWLVKLYPDAGLTTRSYAVSLEEAERLIVEDECGIEPEQGQLKAVEVKLQQLSSRLKKDFPEAPGEMLTFPMLRGRL
ncbi:hypothetical protein K461DRAFT_21325 [Myriangium duriaei CBS 260.36]|uniref:C2H2-type domain-containing protein n=1 Tax=Myriangium duriaei CBS 260.36 TaxID=1168546 RepID=A0A9P4MJX6_9PEZI|nr:hypothetical protein K461DRAFT_21325 [Myriangium duriaei CBS 260.36]